MSKGWKRAVAMAVACAMILPVSWHMQGSNVARAKESGEMAPDYECNFENDVSSDLQGSAKVESQDIVIGEKQYSEEGNQVLTLDGGEKGSSYMKLPSDLYEGVNADTGFTYSFWMKASSDVVSYSRLISSATKAGGDEFAYAPYASNRIWNLIFDSTDIYRAIYEKEPEKNVWNYITFTVNKEEIVFYVNGEKVSSTVTEGSSEQLTARLNTIGQLTENALGKTCSTWGDKDCKAQVDDFRFYKRALTEEEIVNMANEEYGFSAEIKKDVILGSGSEYTDGTQLVQAAADEDLNVAVQSPDGKTEVIIYTDPKKKSYYYSVSQNEKTVLQASALGIDTGTYDFSAGVEIKNVSVSEEMTQEYDMPSGRSSHVMESYREMSFDLIPAAEEVTTKCTVIFRSYNDGVAFRYELSGPQGNTEAVRGEASEYVLPYEGTKMWLGGTSNTYEVDYNSVTMKGLTNSGSNYTIPALAQTAEGKEWVLITEANVFNEEHPYCSSYLHSNSGERNLKVKFGNKVDSVNMDYVDGKFHTPWRVAIITDQLETLVNSNMVTNLNPEADEDTYHYKDWVESFKADWSWWSEAGDDPIEYAPQKDYIDFAAENGWDAVCLDFGWCLWSGYKEKVKELCQYAAQKNVKIMLWYGVNNECHKNRTDESGKTAYPTYSLKTTEQLKEQFEWAHETGVYAVKVDYYESDTQETMKQMEECAKIAAQNQLCVLFHGCTMPGGENRTYPNILSYEAVFGEEYHKFGLGSPTVSTLLTYPYTRNVVGSMDFTPAALPVTSISATAGFQLAETVVFESGTLNLASSIYAYEGNPALGFLNQIESGFEESRLLDSEQAEPGSYVAIARKSKSADKWFVGAMTKDKRTSTLSLDFLSDGVYQAAIFRDNEKGTSVVCETCEVSKETVLSEELMKEGGIAIVLSKEKINLPEQNCEYYEMENVEAVKTAGDAAVTLNPFASGLRQVNLGYGENNSVTWTITASKPGIYPMSLYYKAGTSSQLAYKVNDGNEIKTNLICSGTNSIAKYNCMIELQEGQNTIECYNPNANFVGLDRVAVGTEMAEGGTATASDETDYGFLIDAEALKYKYVEYKATDGQTNAVKEAAGYVGWLGGKAGSYLTITVNVKGAGTYKMRLGYMTAATRTVYISANGGESIQLSCPPTGGYSIDSLGYIFSDIKLKAGKNSITFKNPGAECPNIYSLGISDEAVQAETKTEDKTGTETENEAENKTGSETESKAEEKDSESVGQNQEVAAKADTPQSGSEETKTQETDNKVSDTVQSTPSVSQNNQAAENKSTTSKSKITFAAAIKNWKVSRGKRGVIVATWKKVSGASGYQIQYSKNKKFKKSVKVVVKKTKTKWTGKKLKSGKKYYVRIRAYKVVSGKKVYGKWSAGKSIKVK